MFYREEHMDAKGAHFKSRCLLDLQVCMLCKELRADDAVALPNA